MKITISKSQWQFIGKQTGWMKTADKWEELFGEDAYDAKRDYHGDIDQAIADRQKKPSLTPQQEELMATLNEMWKDKSSADYTSLKERIQNNEFKNKFHLINSIKKRLTTPTPPEKPKSKFEPEYKYVKRGLVTYLSPQPLPPELEEEARQQRIKMTTALVEEAGLQRSKEDRPDVNPWGKPDHYCNFKTNEEVLMRGVAEGKWDEYLAKKMLRDMQETFDALIR